MDNGGTAVCTVLFELTEAQFIVPVWGDKMDYSIGMSYWPVRLHRLADRYDNL